MAGSAFYFDNWMWGDRRVRGARIGSISARSGDVRVKFEGDLRWGKATRGQDLIYNDAIYAGSGSKADLALGNSQMTVSENTLVVLRREKDVSFMNLNYGTLFGRVAKNEKIMIDTGSGAPVEFTTNNQAQIVLRKNGGKTELNVISGEADIVINGKKQRLNNSSKVVLDQQAPAPKVEQVRLNALKPLKTETVYSADPQELPFEWAWTSRRPAQAGEKFALEFSADPSFRKIHASKNVTGKHSSSMMVSKTLSLYYRVRGPGGEFSQTERVNFVRMKPPVIVRPVAQQQIHTPPGQNALVEMEFDYSGGGEIAYQIAADPDFNQIVAGQNTKEKRKLQELSIGSYYARARSDYGVGRQSAWSSVVPFNVEAKLEPLRLTEVPDNNRILIPNRAYPAPMYKAGPAKVRDFLADRGFLNNYFPFKPGTFDELTIAFDGQNDAVKQATPHWPKRNLAPGTYSYKYQVRKMGFAPSMVSSAKKLEIAMEPPRAIGTANLGQPLEDGSREARWAFTPLLFARSYDVEIARDISFRRPKQMKTDQSIASAQLTPGNHYWRARARDAQGRIISDFSRIEKIQIPELVPQALAASEPEPEIEREPAEVAKTVTRVEKEKSDEWERNGWWAWVGSGMNYVDYRQSVQRGTLNSHGAKGPSQYLEAGFNGRKGWGGAIGYKATPGEITIPSANIDNASYTWSTLSLEALLRRKSSVPLLRSPVYYGVRVGVQQHKTPFLFLDADTNLQLKQNKMNTASIGVLAEIVQRRWTHHWLMRYQFPFSSEAEGSNQFEIKPTFAFDGSVGTSYNLTPQLKAGLFWYGQWHQYNFVYGDSEVTNSGFQSLFYSNVDFRLGFDF